MRRILAVSVLMFVTASAHAVPVTWETGGRSFGFFYDDAQVFGEVPFPGAFQGSLKLDIETDAVDTLPSPAAALYNDTVRSFSFQFASFALNFAPEQNILSVTNDRALTVEGTPGTYYIDGIGVFLLSPTISDGVQYEIGLQFGAGELAPPDLWNSTAIPTAFPFPIERLYDFDVNVEDSLYVRATRYAGGAAIAESYASFGIEFLRASAAAPVPEPATWSLLGLGVLALVMLRPSAERRRRYDEAMARDATGHFDA